MTNDTQKLVDTLTFYTALFYKLAHKNKLTRKDFQELIRTTYHYLPVSGGGLGQNSFWENICNAHNITIASTDGELNEREISKLADALWLSYDQDVQHEAEQQKELEESLQS
jgi:hypothetical protein